jgi:hypothetical protein
MMDSLVDLIALPAVARSMRSAAREATRRSAFGMAALLAAAAGLFFFTRSSLVLIERHVDPAEASAILGVAYGVLGAILYFAATKRRRG